MEMEGKMKMQKEVEGKHIYDLIIVYTKQKLTEKHMHRLAMKLQS